MAKRIDVDTLTTQHKGIKGLFEVLLRRFKTGMQLATMLPLYLVGCLILGVCLIPGVFFFRAVLDWTSASPRWLQNLAIAPSLSFGFFLYGMTLIFVSPFLNWLLRCRLKPWRGPYYSAEALKWYVHNALTYLARFTFLEFITPSPLANLFYQMMGMKIGRGTIINTTWISDPSLIELGEKVTLGGSVTIVAHYGQGGLLIIAPVKIGNNCTIGLKSSIMGGVTIGDNAKLMPHSVVLPKTHIPDGETWGGVPARKIDTSDDLSTVQKSS